MNLDFTVILSKNATMGEMNNPAASSGVLDPQLSWEQRRRILSNSRRLLESSTCSENIASFIFRGSHYDHQISVHFVSEIWVSLKIEIFGNLESRAF